MKEETIHPSVTDAPNASVSAGQPSVQQTIDPKRVRPYDFKHPSKLSREQARSLRLILDQFARAASNDASLQLRTALELRVGEIEQTIFQEYRAKLPEHSYFATFSSNPLPQEAIAQMDLDAAFVIADRLLGGPGGELNETRELTAIELALIQRIVGVMLRSWKDAWAEVIDVQMDVTGSLSQSQYLRVMSLNEPVINISFELHILSITSRFGLCLPYNMLEPIAQKLGTQDNANAGQFSKIWVMQVEQLLHPVNIPLSVHLGQASVSLSELTELNKGDIIKLDIPVNGQATVLVGGKEKFHGKIGVRRDKMAVKITDELAEGNS